MSWGELGFSITDIANRGVEDTAKGTSAGPAGESPPAPPRVHGVRQRKKTKPLLHSCVSEGFPFLMGFQAFFKTWRRKQYSRILFFLFLLFWEKTNDTELNKKTCIGFVNRSVDSKHSLSCPLFWECESGSYIMPTRGKMSCDFNLLDLQPHEKEFSEVESFYFGVVFQFVFKI